MRYRVIGVDASSGERLELVLEAGSISEAEGKARARGLRAERVEASDESEAAGAAEGEDSAPLARGGSAHPKRPEEALWRGGPSQWVNVKGYAAALLAGAAMVAGAALAPRALSIDALPWWVYPAAASPALLAALVLFVRVRVVRYELTTQRIRERRGILTRTLEEIELFRVDDSQVRQTLLQRLVGVGTVTLHTSDVTSPRFVLRSVRRHESLRNTIRTEVERRRRERPYETIGGMGGVV